MPLFLVRPLILGWVVLLSVCHTRAQPVFGRTEIRVFDRLKYGGGAQNWAIVQDNQNRLYFANNEGLLVYDGTNWQLYPVPNKTIVRSIGFGPGGKLYVGAQDEFGFFSPDPVGRLIYSSLKNKLPPAERNLTDIWQLEVSAGEVFFRTDSRIFVLSGENLKVFPAPAKWVSLQQHQGLVLAQDSEEGLLAYRQGKWVPLIDRKQLPDNLIISAMVPYQRDSSLLSTMGHGLFLLTGNRLIPFLSNSNESAALQYCTSLAMIGGEGILAGTYYQGVLHLSRSGMLIDQISDKYGLPNNTVRSLKVDAGGKTWVGLDNGIASFDANSGIRQINPAGFNNGAGYDALSINNNLYFALSTGLFRLPYNPAGPDPQSVIPETILKGLTWKLSIVQDQVLAGRDDGLYRISNNQATLISNTTGYWSCRLFREGDLYKMAAGNYLGIRFFEMENGHLTDAGKLEGFKESSRYIETDPDAIWISHPYRGIYRIGLPDHQVTLFTKTEGLPADLDNHVFKIKGKIVIATTRGIYEYDSRGRKMVRSETFDPVFGELPVRYLKEDQTGNIWFVQDKMVGVVDFSSGKPQVHYIPELKNRMVSGFENIFALDTGKILLGSENGFYEVDYPRYRATIRPFQAYLTQLSTMGSRDSVLYGGYNFDSSQNTPVISLPFKLNSLRFTYAASGEDLSSGVEFSYYLQGFDKAWSPWSNRYSKEYTNLAAGQYIFQVKARRSPSHESSVYQISFSIAPPWYQTFWAYAVYLLLFLGMLYGMLKYQGNVHRKKLEARRKADLLRFEEEQKQTAYRHQLELEKSEKELIRLKNEKLEADISYKNAELASATMNLVHKKEFILKLKSQLQLLNKTARTEEEFAELKKILKALGEEEKLDEEWNSFSQHFNSVHGDFLTLLKNRFPGLKPHELRLCAYLRMNLSSKEIAPLMSISVRGVEISRYRLRKKMGLPTEMNLVMYLMDLK